MQGIFIDHVRPASKKAVREALAKDPSSVRLEATSFFGNEYDGPVSEFVGTAHFVGPDPERKRNFYGTLVRTANGHIAVK